MLLLKCFYQPAKVREAMAESLEQDPSERPLHELLELAHFFQVVELADT